MCATHRKRAGRGLATEARVERNTYWLDCNLATFQADGLGAFTKNTALSTGGSAPGCLHTHSRGNASLGCLNVRSTHLGSSPQYTFTVFFYLKIFKESMQKCVAFKEVRSSQVQAPSTPRGTRIWVFKSTQVFFVLGENSHW